MDTINHNENPWRPLHWVQQVARHASQSPDGAALSYGTRVVTWAELDDRTRRLATALADRGVERGSRVLLAATNRPEFIETLVAVHRLGAVLVPVNFRLAPAEIDHIAADSGAVAVVTDTVVHPAIEQTRLHASGVPVLVIGDEGQQGGDEGAERYEHAIASCEPDERIGPDDLAELAFVMYTSGTTGRPKGAMLTYQNLITQTITAMGVLRLVEPDEVAAITSPLFHIASIGHVIPSLMLGHSMVLVETGRFEPGTFLDLLAAHSVTSAFLVPSVWHRVCEEQEQRPRDLSLRSLAWGAEPARAATLELMAATFPEASICSSFGQTEMSPITLVVTGAESRAKLGSVGRPVSLVEVRVVNDDMADVAVGEVGEIVYRGPGTTIGYWNAPEATADAFRGGWFHSGDLVRVDEDGYFYVVDRLKDMIISGGENIYSAEVEQAIVAHPDVADVAVVGAPHPRWGETPVAFVVPKDRETPLDPDDVIAFCAARLAGYKKPSDVLIVDELPRNASGKVLKPTLRGLVTTRPDASPSENEKVNQ